MDLLLIRYTPLANSVSMVMEKAKALFQCESHGTFSHLTKYDPILESAYRRLYEHFPSPASRAASLFKFREEVNMPRSKKRSRTEKPHLITDSLRRKTNRAFAQIKAAQKDLDLKIRQLRDELMANTFRA